MKIISKKVLVSAVFILATLSAFSQTADLTNGWKLSPLGRRISLGDLPMHMVIDPSGKFAVVANAGQSDQSLMVIDLASEKVVDSMPVKMTFYGMTFNKLGTELYSSGGNMNYIGHYGFNQGKLKWIDSIGIKEAWPEKVSPTGMVMGEGDKSLFFATKEDSNLYQVNVLTGAVMGKWHLPSEGYCVVKDNLGRIFVSHWGDMSVGVFDTKSLKWITKIPVGDNPTEMILDKKQKRLFVACADDNTVHIVNTETLAVEEVLNVGIYQTKLTGSGTNSLALMKGDKQLLIANADNNALAIFDVSKRGSSAGLGFVPTGWYPTQVRVVKDKVWVCNGKGFTSLANPKGPNPIERKTQTEYQKGQKGKEKVQYIGGLFRGGMTVFSISEITDANKLTLNTQQVYSNSPYRADSGNRTGIPANHPIPSKLGDTSPIKHVFYIIKENRTYDQVLADMDGGDGDTSLLLFGANITPNQHKLCKEFVLLDHFYVEAEVSADGHNWSTAAYANDYTEKTWPTSYGGRGGEYVYEGQASVAHPQKGFIWDHAAQAGKSYRTYGEFADNYKPNIKSLQGHFCQSYTSWDENVRDTTRFGQWKRDFDSLLNIGQVPQLNTLRFINDHTEGVRRNRPTPFAHVADNDLAVGMFVDYLSKSKIWESSVVFILEDDAQNGPDHVDAHRSTAYVAGGLVKNGFIDHTHYSTSSMLRTMELILGMSPMSQYDASAEPMWRCFQDSMVHPTFDAVPALVDLSEKNVRDNRRSTSYLMDQSEGLDLSKEDRANEQLMNEVLWKYVKGEKSKLPVLRRASWVRSIDAD